MRPARAIPDSQGRFAGYDAKTPPGTVDALLGLAGGSTPISMAITRVWIIEGCISCNLCEDVCSEVFEVPAGGESVLRKAWEKQLARPEVQPKVREAADSCPVEVIKIEESG